MNLTKSLVLTLLVQSMVTVCADQPKMLCEFEESMVRTNKSKNSLQVTFLSASLATFNKQKNCRQFYVPENQGVTNSKEVLVKTNEKDSVIDITISSRSQSTQTKIVSLSLVCLCKHKPL